LIRHIRGRLVVLPLAGAILSSAATLAYLQTLPTTYGAVARIGVEEALRPMDSDRALLRLPSSGVSRSADFPFLPNPNIAVSVLAARTAKVIRGMNPETVADSVHVTDSARQHEFEDFREPVRTLRINARASSAQRAATLANTYAREYVAYHREFFARQTNAIRDGLALRAMVVRSHPNVKPRPKTLQRWIREVARVAKLEARRLRLYDRATAAETSRSPRQVRDVTVAAIIGALAGSLLASFPPAARIRRRQRV
jgi:hypothetical protein